MRPRTRRLLLLTAAIILLLVALTAAGFVWWASTPLGPAEEALAATRSDDAVVVEERAHGIEFAPADDEAAVGLVLYPGARVDVRSYAPLARDIAERGYLVVLVPMRLNLAVLSPDRADAAIEAHPEIRAWVVGGHSLGGAMAARYAERNAARLAGLVLLAAYPPRGVDLRSSGLPVTSIVGSRDGVLDEEAFRERSSSLPADTRVVVIEGGNHAGFGSYGRQPGDLDAAIAPEDQRWEAAVAIAEQLLPLRIRTR